VASYVVCLVLELQDGGGREGYSKSLQWWLDTIRN